MNEIVGYIRVSTQEQGRSGLGLEAQQSRITQFPLTLPETAPLLLTKADPPSVIK